MICINVNEEHKWPRGSPGTCAETFPPPALACEWIDVISSRVRLSLWINVRQMSNKRKKHGHFLLYLQIACQRGRHAVLLICQISRERVRVWWKSVFNKEPAHREQIQNTHNGCVCLSVRLALPTKATRRERLISELLINHTHITQTGVSLLNACVCSRNELIKARPEPEMLSWTEIASVWHRSAGDERQPTLTSAREQAFAPQ